MRIPVNYYLVFFYYKKCFYSIFTAKNGHGSIVVVSRLIMWGNMLHVHFAVTKTLLMMRRRTSASASETRRIERPTVWARTSNCMNGFCGRVHLTGQRHTHTNRKPAHVRMCTGAQKTNAKHVKRRWHQNMQKRLCRRPEIFNDETIHYGIRSLCFCCHEMYTFIIIPPRTQSIVPLRQTTLDGNIF